MSEQRLCSHPLRVRGLKLIEHKGVTPFIFAPITGAWIETPLS